MNCSTDGCGQEGVWWVTSPQGKQKMACVDCTNELTNTAGYEQDELIGHKHGKWDKDPKAQAD